MFVDVGVGEIIGGTDEFGDIIHFLIKWKDNTQEVVPRNLCNAYIPEVFNVIENPQKIIF